MTAPVVVSSDNTDWLIHLLDEMATSIRSAAQIKYNHLLLKYSNFEPRTDRAGTLCEDANLILQISLWEMKEPGKPSRLNFYLIFRPLLAYSRTIPPPSNSFPWFF